MSRYLSSPVASQVLMRYAGIWSPTEFQFLRARLRPSASLLPSNEIGSRCDQ
jgi:hypothetical protein